MTPAELNAHIKKEYDIELLTCPECGKAFSTYDSILYREHRVDPPEDLRTCPFCNYEGAEHDFPDLFQ